MKKIVEICRTKYIWVISTVHFLISCIVSQAFFVPIRENTGSENIAYKFLHTGTSLQTDTLSRALCWIYSHALALLIIVVFWSWLSFLVRSWKNAVSERKYIIILALFIGVGLLMIAALYPTTIYLPPDTRYNYVYAREWLPMYWHGFLTNVIHCACLLVFTHPISMSAIPFLFGINIIFYFTYHTVIKYSAKHKIVRGLFWAVFLFLMPETIQVLTYAGRNYMYVILSISVLGIFLKDYLENASLDRRKFLILSFLEVCLATWRSEGIIYLAFYPFMLYFVYFFKKKAVDKKGLLKGTGYLCALYLLLFLPGKYGSEKYQEYDYFIINTPGPLAAVFADDKANLAYDGVDDDLANINRIVPLEYIYKYGDLATIKHNCDNDRLSRQCHAGVKGKDFVIASYRLLFNNWNIFFKHQSNIYFKSIGLPFRFPMPASHTESWNPREGASEKLIWILDYYPVGESDLVLNHNLVLINQKVDEWISEKALRLVSRLYNLEWKYSCYIKIAVTLLTITVSIAFTVKKKWIYTLWGMVIIGLLSAIILAAPSARENYFYSVYYNQYWFLLFAVFQLKKEKHTEKNMRIEED